MTRKRKPARIRKRKQNSTHAWDDLRNIWISKRELKRQLKGAIP
jgi:hypothetical protein